MLGAGSLLSCERLSVYNSSCLSKWGLGLSCCLRRRAGALDSDPWDGQHLSPPVPVWGLRRPRCSGCLSTTWATLPDRWLRPWGEERKKQARPGASGGWSPSHSREATGCDELAGREWDRAPRSSMISTSGLLPAESSSASRVTKAGAVLRDGPGPDATCPAVWQWDSSCDCPETLSDD